MFPHAPPTHPHSPSHRMSTALTNNPKRITNKGKWNCRYDAAILCVLGDFDDFLSVRNDAFLCAESVKNYAKCFPI